MVILCGFHFPNRDCSEVFKVFTVSITMNNSCTVVAFMLRCWELGIARRRRSKTKKPMVQPVGIDANGPEPVLRPHRFEFKRWYRCEQIWTGSSSRPDFANSTKGPWRFEDHTVACLETTETKAAYNKISANSDLHDWVLADCQGQYESLGQTNVLAVRKSHGC